MDEYRGRTKEGDKNPIKNPNAVLCCAVLFARKSSNPMGLSKKSHGIL
jgi:hypothetical protein